MASAEEKRIKTAMDARAEKDELIDKRLKALGESEAEINRRLEALAANEVKLNDGLAELNKAKEDIDGKYSLLAEAQDRIDAALTSIDSREQDLEKEAEAVAKRTDAKIEMPNKDYAVIRFPGAGKKDEMNYVQCASDDDNGNHEWRTIKRNELVPIEKRFIESLRNAKIPVVEAADEGDDTLRRRKIVDHAPRFPFELFAWINKEAFDKLRKMVLGVAAGGEGIKLTEEMVYEAM